MGFPFLFALCTTASIVIWFVDVEKGRENCRIYVEQRKLVRVAKETGLTTDEIIDGVTSGELVPERRSSSAVDVVSTKASGKAHEN